ADDLSADLVTITEGSYSWWRRIRGRSAALIFRQAQTAPCASFGRLQEHLRTVSERSCPWSHWMAAMILLFDFLKIWRDVATPHSSCCMSSLKLARPLL